MLFSLQGGWWMDPGGIFSNSHHVNVYSGVHCFEIWLCGLDHRLREIGRQHKTLKTYWSSRRFADDIFKSIFLSPWASLLTYIEGCFSLIVTGADIKAQYDRPFMRGIHQWLVSSLAQRASNVENVSIPWRSQDKMICHIEFELQGKNR